MSFLNIFFILRIFWRESWIFKLYKNDFDEWKKRYNFYEKIVNRKFVGLSETNTFVSLHFFISHIFWRENWIFKLYKNDFDEWKKRYNFYERIVGRKFVGLSQTNTFVFLHFFHILHRFGVKCNFSFLIMFFTINTKTMCPIKK